MAQLQLKCAVCDGAHTVECDDATVRSGQPIIFQCPDVDRRYRLVNFAIDGRRGVFDSPGLEKFAAADLERLREMFGSENFDAKFRRWKGIAYPSIGLIEEYATKIDHIVDAYSMGYFYPAVTSSCCLAERILNRLVLRCRQHFKAHPAYKKLHRKKSFDDWEWMLSLVEQWQLISAKAIGLFRELRPIRHQTVHYTDGYDFEAVAESVINKLIEAICEDHRAHAGRGA